jgi:uncharacterized protein (TIGR02266 family)
VPLRRRVRVQLETWDEFSDLYTRDVSEGGVFVQTNDPIDVGARLSVEVCDSKGRAMVLAGEVVHRVPPSAQNAMRGGVGVRFVELSDAEREIIAALIDEAREFAAEGSAGRGRPAVPSDAELESALREQLRIAELGEPHEVLGIGRSATRDELHRAYAHQLKRWHPSTYQGESREILELCTAICRAIKRAYDEATRF